MNKLCHLKPRRTRLSLRQKLSLKAAQIAGNNEGVAALEFALIAPFMIAFYFGVAEVTMGIAMDRQISQTTNIVGDLATQVSSIANDDMSDIMTAAIAVLGINNQNVGRLTVEIRSFEMSNDGSNTINQIGYARMGAESRATLKDFDPNKLVEKNMINPDFGSVVTRVTYDYAPVNYWFMNDVKLTETFVMKPRTSRSVPFTASTGIYTCNVSQTLTVTC